MPTDEELDNMALKVTGFTFAQQPTPNEKARIMELSIRANISSDISSLGEVLEGTKQHLDDIDTSLRTVADWFDKSRLWEGEVRSV